MALNFSLYEECELNLLEKLILGFKYKLQDKKKCLIVANCFADEYVRLLRSSESFIKNYDIKTFTTYVNKPSQDYLSSLRTADLIISQDVKNIPEYTSTYIREHKKVAAIYFTTAFWRFDGYWSYKSSNERVSNWFWFPTDEFGRGLKFHDYINHSIDINVCKAKYESELDKLIAIDREVDIRIFDYFIALHQESRLFTDHWHPVPSIIRYATQQILRQIGIEDSLEVFPPNFVNSYRYRLILNSTKSYLNLSFSDQNMYFFDKYITTEEYFNFTQHLQQDSNLVDIISLDYIKNKFSIFMGYQDNL